MAADITTDPQWQAEQTDRLLAYEILHRSLNADYHPIEPGELADRIGADKGLSHRIITSIQATLNG